MGKKFPALKVRDLDGGNHVIPHGLRGGPHVILLAFERSHQDIIDRWKPALESLAERHSGMEVWEVPSISTAYRLFRSGIDGGMRAGIPDPDTRQHTLTAYTNLGELARDLELPSLDTVYVFLVDCRGSILWRGSGGPDVDALAELDAAMPAGC